LITLVEAGGRVMNKPAYVHQIRAPAGAGPLEIPLVAAVMAVPTQCLPLSVGTPAHEALPAFPTPPQATSPRLPHGADFRVLVPLWPVFMSYVLSFIYIGIYWNKRQYACHPSTSRISYETC
jgi:hypothetical protein